MMVSIYKKLCALSWKCAILRRRNWLLTILDVASPIAVMCFTYYILHRKINGETKKDQKYVGGVPIVQIPRSIFQYKLLMQTDYFPENNYTNSIMDKYFEYSKRWKKSGSIASEKDLESWLHNDALRIGVVFLGHENHNIKYKIRSNYPYMTTTETDVSYQIRQDPYEISGFLPAQCFLDIAFMNSNGIEIEKDQAFFGEFPTVVAIDLGQTFKLIYIFIMVAYLFMVFAIVRDVIEERSSGVNELMKIMGVASWLIWLHWLIYILMVHIPVTIIVALLLTWYKAPVIPANVLVVWLLLFLFTLNSIILIFIISCLFNNPNMAATSSVAVWTTVHGASLYFLDPNLFGFIFQILFCVLPLNNLIWVFQTITSFYYRGVPWSLQYLFSIGSTGSHISVGLSIVISLLETIILVLVLMYVDAVRPGRYGVSKPITFICQRMKTPRDEDPYVRTSLPKSFEPPPKRAKVGIEIRGLHKRFGFFKKVTAVDNVDLDLYEGEIMALLGHNGAGKTTTMSMIMGMFSPNKGVIQFDGKDISRYSNYRDNLGICTQHNLYLAKLTVIQHMIFFGMLKGMSYREAKLAGLKQLKFLNMERKTNSIGSDLSGGMKRRLCLAVSLIGNTKYLILDEPTSGLDPESRRKIWNIILGLRGQRTILITTHFMEEADVLGDRIAIMDQGKIVCCGTTMFLKRLFGTGYHLHILKESNSSPDSILSLVRQYVSNSEMKLISQNQTDFSLKEDTIKQFPGLFAALEDKSSSLGITGISVTCTTMEDVFLKVANKNIEEEPSKHNIISKHSQKSKTAISYDKVKGITLLGVHCKMLLWKLLLYRLRTIKLLAVRAIYASVFLWCTVNTTVIKKVTRTIQPSLLMNLKIFPHYTSVITYDEESSNIVSIARKLIVGNHGKVKILEKTTNITSYLLDLFIDDHAKYSKTLLAIQLINNTITVQYQQKLHLSAIAVNLLTNIILQNASSNSNIEVTNHPAPVKLEGCDISPMVHKIMFPLLWLVTFFFALMEIFNDAMPFLIEERVSGFKHQQMLAGVSPLIYWMSNFIYNYSLYLCFIFIYVTIVTWLGGIVLVESGHVGLLFLVLSMFGISGLFYIYIFTLFLGRVETGMFIVYLCNFFLSLIPAIILSFTTNNSIITPFCLNPVIAVALAIRNIASGIIDVYLCKVCNLQTSCLKAEESLFVIQNETNNGILLYLLFLGLDFLLYFAILLLYEYGYVREILLILYHKQYNSTPLQEDDEDVKKEYDHIRLLKATQDKNTPLRVDGLGKKYFLGTRAVSRVSFVVLPGDCFGLLGVNGAGKTTTFKMLTGEIFPNNGDSVILANSLIANRQKYQSFIGYCTQFDAFILNFTGEEVLKIMGRLRGIPKKDINRIVDEWVQTMGIAEHAKKKIENLSGGTKRKLSTAMAFIGDPVVIFLDEPTSGVDPESRRKLWTVIQNHQGAGQAIVLTSHSMEECEALCTRLTILRDGQMKCIGSSEYLKNKFSQGYTVLFKLVNPNDTAVTELKNEFIEYFPSSTIVDEHATLINYQIQDPNSRLSRLFAVIMRLKEKHDIIEDFIVSNTSLEQVFLSFAHTKKDSM